MPYIYVRKVIILTDFDTYGKQCARKLRDAFLNESIHPDLVLRKRFKALTTGHPVIMGRKTFDSIMARLGKPLRECGQALDRNAEAQVLELIDGLRRRAGCAVVLITHHMHGLRGVADHALLVEFGDLIDDHTLARIQSLDAALAAADRKSVV